MGKRWQKVAKPVKKRAFFGEKRLKTGIFGHKSVAGDGFCGKNSYLYLPR